MSRRRLTESDIVQAREIARARREQSIARGEERQCTRCDELLPVTSFHMDLSRPHGSEYQCKDCKSARHQRRKKERAHAQEEEDWEQCTQ